jgi:hypothetical protein
MRKYIFLSAIVAGLIITACKHPHITVYKEVQVPGKFTIQLPEYLHATTGIFNEGRPSLQYGNDSLNVYMMVFDTGRQNLNEKTLEQYYDSIVPNSSDSGVIIARPKYEIVNKDSVMTTNMLASNNGSAAYYRIETVAAPTRFYYLMIWCKMNKKDSLNDDFGHVLASFKDIEH